MISTAGMNTPTVFILTLYINNTFDSPRKKYEDHHQLRTLKNIITTVCGKEIT